MIHTIYDDTRQTKSEVKNLMISFSSYAAKQEDLATAFPDGDPDGHRKAHEAWIRREQARAVFWERIRDEAVKWGIFGVIGFVVMAVWMAIKTEVHK